MAFLKFNKSELVNLSYSLKREIMLANKSGAFCNTSIVTCNTRRYHGLLAVPVEAFDGYRHLLLSSLDESLTLRGKRFNLGIHCYGDVYEPRGHKYIVDFDADPVPCITYKIGEIVFRKKIALSPDACQVMIQYELVNAPARVKLELKPFLAFRNVHALTSENEAARQDFTPVQNGAAFCMYEGFPQGFDCREDLWVPGSFEVELKSGDTLVFSASAGEPVNAAGLKRRFNATVDQIGPINSFQDQLLRQADTLIRNDGGRKRIVAGYSWLYTGLLRETLFSLAGLTLYGKNDPKEFEEILDNLIADNQERLSRRTTQVEAPLFLAVTLQQYIAYGAKPKDVWAKYGPVMKAVIESYLPGRRQEVAMQPNGLLWAQKDGVALTWMNAYINGRAVAFALENEKKNGAFYKKWNPVKEIIENNFQPLFWNADLGFLADYVDNAGQHLELRPNQLWAVSLDHRCVDDEVVSEVMRVVNAELVTRRGIRTLSPRDIRYKGVYEGTQLQRDEAYHNGSAWPFLLAQYCYASFGMMGANFIGRAEWLTEGFYEDLSMHGVGCFSELYDGDPPHEAHGAISSAMTTAALLNINWLIDKYRED